MATNFDISFDMNDSLNHSINQFCSFNSELSKFIYDKTSLLGAAHISLLLRAQVRYFKCKRAVCSLIMEAVRRVRFFQAHPAPHRDKNISTFQNAASAPQVMWRNVLLVTESAVDGCLATTNASGAQPPERFGKKEKAVRLAFSTRF